MKVEREAFERFMNSLDRRIYGYIENLKLWNGTVNLVSRDTIDDVYNRHILDCMQLAKYLNKDDNIIDVGSGAGLPGVILSIMGYEHVTLCEIDFKKCIFLYDIKDKLGLKYNVYNGDVYKYCMPREDRDRSVLVARAFASLRTLLDVMIKLEVVRGIIHKGARYKDEIELANHEYQYTHIAHKSETNETGVILEIESVRRK